MIDFNRIPKPIYDELVMLVGKEKAEDYIIKSNYNYSIINWGIRTFYWRLFYKKNKIIIWLGLTGIIVSLFFSFID